ncbi:MAG: outer membrane beta-barrel protein [Allomuricauda sp.]|jgi:Outer membrane protein beta-barrel domain
MGKKNLEQLFKEKFRDFQEVPDQKVWDAIEHSLDNKKQKKRIIPFWWSLGGIAAALALLLMLINPFAENPKEEHIISDSENIISPDSNNAIEEGTDSFDSPSLSRDSDNEISSGEFVEKESPVENNDLNAAGNKTEVASSNFSRSNNNTTGIPDKEAGSLEQTESLLSKTNEVAKNNPTIIANNDSNGSSGKQAIATTKNPEEAIAVHEEIKDNVGEQSIYDAIQEQEELDNVADKNNPGKWSVGPSLAPVYFDASGDGSPIGPDFSSNSKSGNLNLSYGLTVSYEVGQKLKIRSGVHRVNFGYSTNDILFSSTLRAASADKISTIDYNPNSSTLVVESRESAKASPSTLSKEVALNSVPSLDGKMLQQLGYIEVPLEVNYAVVDKKFGVDLIGGFSSLFLVDNSVLLESNSLVTEIGEANNINSLNFSANVGMGLNYRFSPKIEINVEPVFKYQLNTFSNVSGNFQPYSIGVYSGFSFRF